MQAEKEVSELQAELQAVEDELDAAESRLSELTLQLGISEAEADENERYCSVLCGREYFKYLLHSDKCHKFLQQTRLKSLLAWISTTDLKFIADC